MYPRMPVFCLSCLSVAAALLLSACGGGDGAAPDAPPAPAPAMPAPSGPTRDGNQPPTGGVYITGEPQVGQVLMASNDLQDADGLGSITYHWYAGGLYAGKGSSYTLQGSDKDSRMRVQASYFDGKHHVENVVSAPTQPVRAGATPAPTPSPTVTPVPSPSPAPLPSPTPSPAPNQPGQVGISGQAVLGETLNAQVTDADGVPVTGVRYQWQADGQPIPGATQNSYQPQVGNVGQVISVTVFYVDERGHDENITSAPTAAVQARNLPGSISIRGNAIVGQTLTAHITDGNGVPASGIAYQWLANSQAIAGATGPSYLLQAADAGKTIRVQARYTDPSGYAEAPMSVSTSLVASNQPPTPGGHAVHRHPVYGPYLDVRDFGADTTGQQDSIDAIRRALAEAHKAGAGLYLHGTLYITEQIRLDASNANVPVLFGEGMGKTLVRFAWQQGAGMTQNAQSNEDDTRDYAGILIDGQDGKTIANLSVQYQGEFYRRNRPYFGFVNCIQITDSSNTTVDQVEASGCNRAGVFFTSVRTLEPDPASAQRLSYKERLRRHEISESQVPVGEGNRLTRSYLHHNRVAGALVAYQKSFAATNNRLEYNGHTNSGGTGYGIATMAGSYNFGVTYRYNATRGNYRKGLDAHDGNDIVIEYNTSISDRLYGIAVYNRNFPMNRVRIAHNIIQMDPDNRQGATRENDDYFGQVGINLETNTFRAELGTASPGLYEVIENTISGLAVGAPPLATGQTRRKWSGTTYGIEFRNHEQEIDYTLNIAHNKISGENAASYISVINDTAYKNKPNLTGKGSGTINLTDNTIAMQGAWVPGSGPNGASLNSSEDGGTAPIYVLEHSSNGQLRGSVNILRNTIDISKYANTPTELLEVVTNAHTATIEGNTINVTPKWGRPAISLKGIAPGKTRFSLKGNRFNTGTQPDVVYPTGSHFQYEESGNQFNGRPVSLPIRERK